ncbi:hypothetical protein, partial [Pseudomonas aeruginosa]|uniref:hypothetical protein n=1 Tax=Pseudomonas aeruginosa TaxID=287 RepID=UPI001C4E7715
MLAKNAQAPRFFSISALSLTIFASKLAPTVGVNHHEASTDENPRHFMPATHIERLQLLTVQPRAHE